MLKAALVRALAEEGYRFFNRMLHYIHAFEAKAKCYRKSYRGCLYDCPSKLIKSRTLSCMDALRLTKLSVPIIILAINGLLEAAQTGCQVAWSTQVHHEVASCLAVGLSLGVVLIVGLLHLQNPV